MTEKEFTKQVWRQYDTITTADGVPGKVLAVSFNTKSVRAFISGAPEWLRCELIETHTTGKGGNADDAAAMEDLQNRLANAEGIIAALSREKQLLTEKIGKNYLGDLLRAVNIMRQGLQEKRHKIEQVESALKQIDDVMERISGTE